jgi:hypothetical protein
VWHKLLVPTRPSHITIVVSSAQLARLTLLAPGAENDRISHIPKEFEPLLWSLSQCLW